MKGFIAQEQIHHQNTDLIDNNLEKRRYFRFESDKENEISLQDTNNRVVIDGKVKNISLTGILIECQIHLNNLIYLKDNELIISHLQDIDCKNIFAKIVRISKQNKKNNFLLGLELNRQFEKTAFKNMVSNMKS